MADRSTAGRLLSDNVPQRLKQTVALRALFAFKALQVFVQDKIMQTLGSIYVRRSCANGCSIELVPTGQQPMQEFATKNNNLFFFVNNIFKPDILPVGLQLTNGNGTRSDSANPFQRRRPQSTEIIFPNIKMLMHADWLAF
jgi:hypothetical protein